jgi:hypothetical protein
VYLSLVFNDDRFLSLEEEWIKPSSFLHLIEAANVYGIALKGYRIQSLAFLKRLKKPFILYQQSPTPHYVVIQPLGFGVWKRYDPANGIDIIFNRTFKNFPLTILYDDLGTKIKPSKFNYFLTPQFPMLFFLMSGFFLSTLFLSFLFFPSFRFMHEMFIPLFILSGLWLAYVLTLLSSYHRWMDEKHARKIKTKGLFKQYYLIKTMTIQLPLTYVYTLFSLIAISLYFFLQPIELLPGLWISALLGMIVKYPFAIKQKKLSNHVETFESDLTYPFVDATKLRQMNHWGLQYFYLQVIQFFINLSLSVLFIYLSSYSTPINGTQWLLSVSLFLSFYKLLHDFRSIHQTKTTLFTMMNAFINSHDVIK